MRIRVAGGLAVVAAFAVALAECGESSPPTDAGPGARAPVHSTAPRYHRATATACTPAPAGRQCTRNTPFFFDGGDCSGDTDCTTGRDGRCNCGVVGSTGVSVNTCTYDPCLTDDDCGQGGVCACAVPCAGCDPTATSSNACLPANCRTDDDCGTGGYCSLSPLLGCGSRYGYFCHKPIDDCYDDTDCGGNGVIGPYCAYSQVAGKWVCSAAKCADS